MILTLNPLRPIQSQPGKKSLTLSPRRNAKSSPCCFCSALPPANPPRLSNKQAAVKEIQLDKGQVALVDDDDFERVNAFKWQSTWNNNTGFFYAKRTECNNGKSSSIYMSRFIMNTPKGITCDHINHNTLDNRKSNLRNCTYSQNSFNRRTRKDNAVQHKNITASCGKFRVQLMINKKYVFRKTFSTLQEAIFARDRERKIHFGEFDCKE